jgi:hypothetical protein
MKIALLSLLLAGLGLGWLPLAGERGTDARTCPPEGCRVEVSCTPRGTCLVTCFAADGSVICQEEVSCDEPCEKPCPKGRCASADQ